MTGTATEIARAFCDARASGQAISEFPGAYPGTLAEAYAIQDEAIRLTDAEIGGWKVGRIMPPEDARLGANRLSGPVFASSIRHDEAGPQAMPIFAGGFAAAEAEFMLRLAPPAGASLPKDAAEAATWIDDIRIGVEIASSPYAAINTDGPCVTICDNGNNHGILLGPQVPRDRWASLSDVEITVEVDGKTVGKASANTMLDGPFGAVRFLLENLHERGIEPQAGWWVSSGAVTGVHEVASGCAVTCRFAGLGEVSLTIA